MERLPDVSATRLVIYADRMLRTQCYSDGFLNRTERTGAFNIQIASEQQWGLRHKLRLPAEGECSIEK